MKTQDRIHDAIRRLNPKLLCLVETKTDIVRTQRFCNTLSKHWDWVAIPSRGLSGGIIVLWRRDLGSVTPVANSHFVLHLVISSNNVHWILSVIYNAQVTSLQNSTWNNLSFISSLNLPWILAGDFNAILTEDDHKGGTFHNYSAKASLFSNFTLKNDLIDLGFVVPRFTWCNGQYGLARRWARLDRYLVNSNWISIFNNFSNKHLPWTVSDHSPIYLSVFSNPPFLAKKPFRFENIWFD